MKNLILLTIALLSTLAFGDDDVSHYIDFNSLDGNISNIYNTVQDRNYAKIRELVQSDPSLLNLVWTDSTNLFDKAISDRDVAMIDLLLELNFIPFWYSNSRHSFITFTYRIQEIGLNTSFEGDRNIENHYVQNKKYYSREYYEDYRKVMKSVDGTQFYRESAPIKISNFSSENPNYTKILEYAYENGEFNSEDYLESRGEADGAIFWYPEIDSQIDFSDKRLIDFLLGKQFNFNRLYYRFVYQSDYSVLSIYDRIVASAHRPSDSSSPVLNRNKVDSSVLTKLKSHGALTASEIVHGKSTDRSILIDAEVTDDGVRFRSDPGFDANIMYKLSKGTVLRLIDVSQFSYLVNGNRYFWLLVVDRLNNRGWVSGEFINIKTKKSYSQLI